MKIIAANLDARPCTALVLTYGVERSFVASDPLRLAKVIAKDDDYLEGVEGTLTQLTEADAERLSLSQPKVAVACAA